MNKVKLMNYDIISSNKSPNSKFITANKKVLNDMNVDKAWNQTKGAGMKVGIIDTGIDEDHPDLVKSIKDGYTPVVGKTSIQDKVGHGTHVAGSVSANGILKGVAPEAELYIAKAFVGAGSTSISNIVKCIAWCIDKNVDVISLSLGTQNDSSELKMAINSAVARGITIVCAVGNDANGNKQKISIDYPASYNNTLAVGAISEYDTIANFSSVGNVDVVTNGIQVASTYLKGSYAMMSGTSMATPQIAGAVTLYHAISKIKRGKKLTRNELSLLFAMNTYDLGVRGKDQVYGFGEFKF